MREDARLRLVLRSPRELVAELDLLSLRVPTETGHVGLRPGVEPAVLAVEPGLVLAREAGGLRFVATAGGLLRCNRTQAVLLTPLAVTGTNAKEVLVGLETALSQPDPEFDLRRAIQRLEKGILAELRRADVAGPPRGDRL